MLEPSGKNLLEMYVEERNAHTDTLTKFPPFRRWKQFYLKTLKEDNIIVEEELIKEKLVDIDVKVPVQSIKKESKMDKAYNIYKDLVIDNELPKRKDVLEVFVRELGMSMGYASTAHNKIKQRFIK